MFEIRETIYSYHNSVCKLHSLHHLILLSLPFIQDTPFEELLAHVLKATIDRTKIDPKIVGDIVVGSVLGQNAQRANEVRIGQFLAGIPDTVPIHLINRQCSSGLQALAHVAANINAGFYEVGIAAGVESMSSSAFGWNGGMNPKVRRRRK